MKGKLTATRKLYKKNPQMLENIQRQIDEIIDYINAGILTEYDTWPNDIKIPLGLESEGQIVIDTSRLDIKKQNHKEQKRIYEFTETEKHRPQDDVIKTMYRRYGKKRTDKRYTAVIEFIVSYLLEISSSSTTNLGV